MKTLLYASDLRTESVSQLKYAYKLSKLLNVRLIVLHVYDLPPVSIPDYLNDLQIDLKISDEKRHALRVYCYEHLDTEISKNNNELEVQAVEDTSVVNGILSAARSVFADLILVGTHGKHKKKELFAGNIARSLVTKVGAPLMIVPHETKELKIHTIVYASALESNDIMALKTLASIARPFLANIKVLHISTKDEYQSEEQLLWFKELVQEHLDYKRIEYEAIASEDIFGTINKYVIDSKADVLAMLERKERNLLRSLYHQDLVKKIQTDLSIPLISFRMDK